MNLCDINTLRALLGRHGFHFSKSMGQNFLIDDAVPCAIAEASGADENTGVLEIGPGVGCLTQELCARAGRVVSVELDRALIPVLSETMAQFDNFKLVSGDIMKTDIDALVETELAPLRPIVCANLPYNITSPVLTALVKSRRFSSITVLVQREVALRIAARAGTSDYGAFSLLMQYYTDPQIVLDVPRDAFLPAPKVDSAVVHCVCRKTPVVDVDEAHFFRTVRGGFALRRKTLVNSLMNEFGSAFSKEELAAAITECGFDANIRGERLTLHDYAALSNKLISLKK